MDSITRTAEQIVAIEAARAYVAEIETGGPIDMGDTGRLIGRLMGAETLLMEIAAAYAEGAGQSGPEGRNR
ncbi:hypothetical protein ACIRQP_02020 [Streptomyces sp. NPDC102274]|uniref:hypothetical protein n=1 Tax=Streptomyces sp. NPDC102274 TaxID=3366151 RepID=UPI0038082BB8